jgi:large subunit ribosomal protein L4
MKLKITDIDSKAHGEIDLADEVFKDIFGRPVRRDILARCVNWQLAKRRSGNHKTKEIGDISGTTKKPYSQKGTGNARQGSLRSPQFRGGATIFGPVVRSHAHDLTKKVRKLALKTALSSKVKDGKLIVWNGTAGASGKTKDLTAKLKTLGLKSVLVIDGPAVDEKFALAARNIPNVDVLPQQGANVYDILRRDTLVLTKAAVEHLVERLK